MHDNRQFLKSLAFVNENLMVNQSSYPSSCIFSTIPRANVFAQVLGSFNHTFRVSRVRLRVVFAIFSSLASLKILLLVAQGILCTFFLNRFILRKDNYLNHRDQTEVSFLWVAAHARLTTML